MRSPFLPFCRVLQKNDPQAAAVFKRHALAQPPLAAQTVQGPRHRARVLAQLRRFPLEPVNLLDHLNRYQDIVFLKTEQAVWVVEEDIGVKDVVFHVNFFQF